MLHHYRISKNSRRFTSVRR